MTDSSLVILRLYQAIPPARSLSLESTGQRSAVGILNNQTIAVLTGHTFQVVVSSSYSHNGMAPKVSDSLCIGTPESLSSSSTSDGTSTVC